MMPIQEKCRILAHQKIGPNHFKLILASAYISSHASPGQFVNIKCTEGRDPLLRRPLSLHRIQKELKIFELLYEMKGKGTELLSKYFVGEELDVLGPLGQGFKLDQQKNVSLLVGGGIGIAPLMALAESIKTTTKNVIYVLIGTKTRGCTLCEEELKKITDQVLPATDDGTYGRKGVISDLLLDLLNNTLSDSYYPNCTIFACGPKSMLQSVANIAYQKKIDCQVSMEERMACGVGACKGCAVKTKAGYKMVCKDGPVFNGEEIIW